MKKKKKKYLPSLRRSGVCAIREFLGMLCY